MIKRKRIYGAELWKCASKSNIQIIQRRQLEVIRMVVDISWYVSNQTLHKDLNIPFANYVIEIEKLKTPQKIGEILVGYNTAQIFVHA
nr:unnamed protein product [Callosobruchus chinensis]